ncbi:MAG: helix-turn-helix domain-containing protein [Clostridia bacterium]|jgi:AraC-like DNA-binding protein|nr:helix-turn-helix domain-containing protein [Clostridia bacterium]
MRPEPIEFDKNRPVRVCVASGNRYPYHWHTALEIIQVLEGKVNIGLGDDELVLTAGDIAIANMEELHRLTGDGADKILFIQIDEKFCRRVLPRHYLFIYCCSPYHESRAPAKYQALKEYITRLAALYGTGPGPGSSDIAAVEKLLQEMLTYLAYHFDLLRWGYGTQAFDEKRVTRLRCLAKHTTSDPEVQRGLKDLAAELGVSLQHLSSDISERFGMTFQELLCYGRCERAARLLLGSDRRVVDIAEECGFSDAKYLIKYFKRTFHCTPSEFRKNHK